MSQHYVSLGLLITTAGQSYCVKHVFACLGTNLSGLLYIAYATVTMCTYVYIDYSVAKVSYLVADWASRPARMAWHVIQYSSSRWSCTTDLSSVPMPLTTRTSFGHLVVAAEA